MKMADKSNVSESFNYKSISELNESQFISEYEKRFGPSNRFLPAVSSDSALAGNDIMKKLHDSIPTDYRNTYVETFNAVDKDNRDAIIYKTLNIPPPNTTKSQMTKNAFGLFDRYYSINPDMELTDVCHYIFMTRPDLNIATMINGKPSLLSAISQESNEFVVANQTNPDIIKSLISPGYGDHEFIPVITSRVEGLQLPDFSLRTYTIEQPYSGYTMPISTHGIHSTTGGQFDLTLRETGDLSMHKLFQLWTKYINDITLGKYSPRSIYISENRCDYAVSVYDIICAPDGKTILYWVKYVGAFPNITPISDLSFNKGSSISNQLNITFDYFLSEPMNLYSLVDFNLNANVYTMSDIKAGTDVLRLNTTKNAVPEEVKKGGSMVDQISYSLDRTMDQGKGIWVPIYGTGDSLYKRPYIKFHWNDGDNSRRFPELCWEKY